jgi:hypothetical protein
MVINFCAHGKQGIIDAEIDIPRYCRKLHDTRIEINKRLVPEHSDQCGWEGEVEIPEYVRIPYHLIQARPRGAMDGPDPRSIFIAVVSKQGEAVCKPQRDHPTAKQIYFSIVDGGVLREPVSFDQVNLVPKRT